VIAVFGLAIASSDNSDLTYDENSGYNTSDSTY
jgi:hypothetical protein